MPKLIAGIRIYTFDEVLELIGVSRPVLRKYIGDGRIQARRIGKSWVITEIALQEWLTGKTMEREMASRNAKKKD
jgi:excisionase family DNA binding protein